MDDASTSKGAGERSFCHEEEGEHEEVEISIADGFGSYDCFMQPFESPDEGDEQTKELEMECFDQLDKNNFDHTVTAVFYNFNNVEEPPLRFRAVLFNHGTSFTTREIISEFFQLKLNATYNTCTPVQGGRLYGEAPSRGLSSYLVLYTAWT